MKKKFNMCLIWEVNKITCILSVWLNVSNIAVKKIVKKTSNWGENIICVLSLNFVQLWEIYTVVKGFF